MGEEYQTHLAHYVCNNTTCEVEDLLPGPGIQMSANVVLAITEISTLATRTQYMKLKSQKRYLHPVPLDYCIVPIAISRQESEVARVSVGY